MAGTDPARAALRRPRDAGRARAGRLAWAATRVFCLLNGQDLRFGADEGEQLVVAVAAGAVDVPDLTAILERQLGREA